MFDDKPLNVWAGSDEEIGRLMSNLAHTPIMIDGVIFGSVEAFITWLVTDPTKIAKREKIRSMWGRRSKTSAPTVWPELISYGNKCIRVEGAEWCELLKNAIRIKMKTYPDICAAFVATRPRSLLHTIHGIPKSPEFLLMITELREEFATVMLLTIGISNRRGDFLDTFGNRCSLVVS
jgi:hypothetical protein